MFLDNEAIADEEEKILLKLVNGGLGIRQLIDRIPNMGQRALYKNLKKMKQDELIYSTFDGYRNLQNLTKKGFEKAKKRIAYRRIERETRYLLYSSDQEKKMSAFKTILKELFLVFYPDKWTVETGKNWSIFTKSIESTIMDLLNKDVPNKNSLLANSFIDQEYHDVYFVINTKNSTDLLEEALFAKQNNQCLTENHQNILVQATEVSFEELEKHNKRWRELYPIGEIRSNQLLLEENERDKYFKKNGLMSTKSSKITWARDRPK